MHEGTLISDTLKLHSVAQDWLRTESKEYSNLYHQGVKGVLLKSAVTCGCVSGVCFGLTLEAIRDRSIAQCLGQILLN